MLKIYRKIYYEKLILAKFIWNSNKFYKILKSLKIDLFFSKYYKYYFIIYNIRSKNGKQCII